MRLVRDGNFLRITLPSGRALSYPFPRIEIGPKYGEPCVIFKDASLGKWTDCNFGRGAYGGLWTENIVSGIARDLLGGAMLRLEAAGYPIVLTVHDEIVCEVPDGFGSLEEFQRIITAVPDWANGLPIAAKVRNGERFSKSEKPAAPAGMNPSGGIPDDLSIPDFLRRAPATVDLGDGGGGIEDDDHSAESATPDELGAILSGAGDHDSDQVDDQASANGQEDNGAGRDDDFDAGANGGVGDDYGQADRHHSDDHAGERHNGGNGAAGEAERKRHAASNGRDRQAEGKIRCPFHKDDRPSLQLYGGDDPHYHCFGCGAHGPLSDLPEELITAAPSSHTQTDDAETLDYAHRLWDQAKPIAGTLAELYLAEIRGIDVSALPPDIDKALRFHPRCPFSGNRHPCLLALFRDVETDKPAGIHRIALTPDAQKIERRMLGRWSKPRAIKFWPATNQLYFGEGIETVLGAATKVTHRGAPMRPAWAAGSDGGLSKLPIIPGVERLIILVDNDLNGAGQAAAMRCTERWSRAGRAVIKLTPKRPGADFNDIAKEKVS